MPKDILLTDDLQISNGDLMIGESTYQHQKTLIYADKGEFKHNPKIGVGVKRYFETEKPEDFAREIRFQFLTDGMKVNKIEIADNLEVNIDATYNDI